MKNLLNKIIHVLGYSQLFDSLKFAEEFNNVSNEKDIEID